MGRDAFVGASKGRWCESSQFSTFFPILESQTSVCVTHTWAIRQNADPWAPPLRFWGLGTRNLQVWGATLRETQG